MQSSLVYRGIVVLSTVLISVAALAFPEYRQALAYGLVAVIVGAVILWQHLRIKELQTEVSRSKQQPIQTSEDYWPELVNTKLVLDDWRATSSFRLEAGTTIRITASAPKRFILHLATDVVDEGPARKRRFHSVERNPEAMEVKRTFKIPKSDDYSIVLEPAGSSAFRAEVRVQREPEPIRSTW